MSASERMIPTRRESGRRPHLPSEGSADQEDVDVMSRSRYLVVWWMSQVPHAAVFENRVAAEAAASVRNALMVTLSGRDAKIDSVLDSYRRDDAGEPMPAEWRDLLGQIQVPWTVKRPPALKAAGA